MQDAPPNDSSDEVLRSLLRCAGGGKAATPELFASLYAELHRISESQLRCAQGALTVSPTTLLHEAYLSLAGRDGSMFPDRNRFLGYAARAMRSLVIDHLRRRRAQKRGNQFFFTAIDTNLFDEVAQEAPDWSRLGDSLEELAQLDPPLAELVDLRFFCGLSIAEIAALRGTSARTVDRDWLKAKMFLRIQLDEPDR